MAGVTINSNLASLRSARQLATASDALGRVFERLSSGQRINRASDDAAGLSIVTRLEASSRVYQVAARNVSDGLSYTAVMSGGLQQQMGLLDRLSELAQQAANGVYSSSQRSSLDREYQQLVEEFRRISESTAFNGLRGLQGSRDGGSGSLALQVGVNGGAGSTISVNGVDTGWFSGTVGVGSDINGDGFVDDADFIDYATRTSLASSLSAEELLELSDSSSIARITFTDGLGREREGFVVLSNTFADFNTLYSDFVVGEASPTRFSEYRASIFVKDIDADTYTAAAVTDGGVVSGAQLSVGLSLGGGGADTTIDLDFSNTTFLWDDPGPVGASTIEFSGLETGERALLALTTLSNKRQELSGFLGGIGAFESRLNSALAVLAAARENSEAAAARIRDADMGAESANLVRLQILQQAGAAVLSQANIQPTLALALLG